MENTEKLILNTLCTNDQYTRYVLPHIRKDYFTDRKQKLVFNIIKDYFEKYNNIITEDAYVIELDNNSNLNEDDYNSLVELKKELFEEKSTQHFDWLINQTEKWCKDKAIYLALMEAISIHDGSEKDKTPEAIPFILSEALSVSFDKSVGHDYIDDWEERYKFYTSNEQKIPFDIEYFNKVTNGGLPKGTLNVLLAGCVHPETKIKIRLRKRQ